MNLLDPVMFDLFKTEIETQCAVLNQGLIDIEQGERNPTLLSSLMRAAHSVKGAARVMTLELIVHLAHAMEDSIVAAQKDPPTLTSGRIDQLLRGVDFLKCMSTLGLSEVPFWLSQNESSIKDLTAHMRLNDPSSATSSIPIVATEKSSASIQEPQTSSVTRNGDSHSATGPDRVLRMTAHHLNRLVGLAGELLVESRWLSPFAGALQRFKKHQDQLSILVDKLRENLRSIQLNEETQHHMMNLQHELIGVRHELVTHLSELDQFIGRHESLSDHLYREILNSRMRPFSDGVEGFSRMVRDLAKETGKRAHLVIEGKSTLVDRDILEKLEAPLGHLLRNALDHGIEKPEEREAVGKAPEGVITLKAYHSGGVLAITVSDDGRGIDVDHLRKLIVDKKLVTAELASHLSEKEIFDFLFLPGFSTTPKVTEISGRGVGLNVVLNFVQDVGGQVHVSFISGKGSQFYLQLPLTLSVMHALLIEIAGELYALPLARIQRIVCIDSNCIQNIKGRQYFQYNEQNIALISAHHLLGFDDSQTIDSQLSVVILNDRLNDYAIIVDRLLGEKELVVQELDPRLGKVNNIIAGALTEEGHPVLIIDIDDLFRSIDQFLSVEPIQNGVVHEQLIEHSVKRILVIDDSITVREAEYRLLQKLGYEVDTAVNGVDGWNAVRIGHYNLIITDVDMPRMNGIELVKTIKKDERFKNLPIIIVTYKESEEDRMLGLDAGADYYLTKSSFQDTTLLDAVRDVIGEPYGT